MVSVRNLSLQREKSLLPCCYTKPLRRVDGRQLGHPLALSLNPLLAMVGNFMLFLQLTNLLFL